MSDDDTVGEGLRARGVSRRAFLKFCTAMTSFMALPPTMAATVAEALEKARRPSLIWLAFQGCTGCTETLTRSHQPTLETLLFNVLSLDAQETLQAAAGEAAEAARREAMQKHWGHYVLLVEGSIPLGDPGCMTSAGISGVEILQETAQGAALVMAVGTCAAFGGLPHASPNPTGAVPVSALIKDKPVVNVSGCPPIPVVLTGVLVHYLTFGKAPELDAQGRPLAFYRQTIHHQCERRPFYRQNRFAESFDDQGAKRGWCLYNLGCKGPVTYNACATLKWNQGTSYPIQSGHGCLGCSEPDFWDRGGFYQALPQKPGRGRRLQR